MALEEDPSPKVLLIESLLYRGIRSIYKVKSVGIDKCCQDKCIKPYYQATGGAA